MLLSCLFSGVLVGQAVPAAWQLTCEKTDFRQTGRHAETVEFCRRLAAASSQVKSFSIGTSPQGREITALLLSKERGLTPAAARSSRKPLIFIEAAIHSGEVEGKDACLMLARDILITKTKAALLDQANLLIVPIFSVDAHERFSRYGRVNQNGPEEMGWRTTATNLNLNRDFAKADAGEMKALLRLLQAWKPDIFFDLHTTDGGDWQYVITWDISRWPTMDPDVAQFSATMENSLAAAVEKDGFVCGPYFGGINPRQPELGVTLDTYGPRFSHGYYGLYNRPSILVETHVLKPYKPRVLSTYSLLERTIQYAGARAEDLKRLTRQADARERQLKEGSRLVTSARVKDEWRPWTFLGYEFTPYDSPVTGGQVRSWNRSKPIRVASRIRDQFEAGGETVLPAAYLVPSQWTEVIERLDLHGISYRRLRLPAIGRPLRTTVQVMKEPRFPTAPSEGRFTPSFTVADETRTVVIPNGSVLVPVGQPGARMVVQLLEPSLPDSFARWGFFNAVFQRTEYSEDYAMEPEARKMLERDPELKRAFEERMKDPAFASSPQARLQWFYERSPWFDQTWQVHPVLRLTSAQVAELTGNRP